MNFVDLTYYHLPAIAPEAVLVRQQANLGYMRHLPGDFRTTVVKFLDRRVHFTREGIDYHFFPGGNSRLWWPRQANNFIQSLHPDVVLIHGLVSPLQLLGLRTQLGKKPKLLVQHHAEGPGKGLMRFFQTRADKVTDAYLFHSKEQAKPWVQSGIISSADKVFEITEGSTSFKPMNREEARRAAGVAGEPSFLWVGRLNANKDPLTVVKGFADYSATHPGARLYMIYSEDELLPEVESFLQQRQLSGQVVLVGRKAHDELRAWYSAADFYISGSHSEGSGYALIEAMACGCIPVVTDIPSYRKMTDNSRLGFLYKPGNPEELSQVLESLKADDASRQEVRKYFEEKLSFEAIAKSIADVCRSV